MNIATTSEYTAATTADSVGVKMPNFRPKMMMNGSIKAQKLSMTARPISRPDFLGGGVMFSLRTSHHHATASPMPISTPGMRPARNSLVIETPPMTPNTTKPMLGGMMGPITPEAAIKPPARLVVPSLHHHGHEQRRERGGVRHGRARQGGEDAGGHNRYVAEPALDVADGRER